MADVEPKQLSLLLVATFQAVKDRAYQKGNRELLGGTVRHFDNNEPPAIVCCWLAGSLKSAVSRQADSTSGAQLGHKNTVPHVFWEIVYQERQEWRMLNRSIAATGGYFADSKRSSLSKEQYWLLAGWWAEERRVSSGRLYRFSGKLYIKKGKNGGCRTKAIVATIRGGYFANSKRSGSSKEKEEATGRYC
ncbi:hypothetical protein GOBAR_DD24836 [Gossypium barbadense]|nr:hypothetical protein GOBAR_DD24836 [Gossypium barbadense]